MIRYRPAESQEELKEILRLQQNNLSRNISPEEREREGFVTVEHTLELLGEMNAACAHIIALEAGVLIGYALCMHPKFRDRIAVLGPMFTELDRLLPKTAGHMIMGQVCVAKGHRGKGVFRMLYRTMKDCLPHGFGSIITEVD